VLLLVTVGQLGYGAYWYSKVEAGSHRYEFWIKPDGRRWYRYAGGKVEQQPGGT
jgi:hypothetical protein